ncbi:hypothetical protein QTP70_011538 [Hemibagrus guttatus]|uniref:Alkylated DNA repair protein AlkB homologue 8 N-terminal domain-containing protein n=1 Tax=Hemibagrus guttatus TaxID=175788 RepID=A0AAE0R2R4_9TELE|nr:hypothetical protein QTP70_011538 [Hemibagrus guttatus]
MFTVTDSLLSPEISITPISKQCFLNFTSLWTLRGEAQSGHSALFIDGSSVEIVERTKFLGVHLAENFTWSLNTTSITKKAQQCLYILRRLRKAHLPPAVLTGFYRWTIESVLSSCITAWFGNCTVSDRKTLQRIVRTAEKIIRVSFPSIIAIVFFLNDVAKVTKLTGQGIVINNKLKLVSPLRQEAAEPAVVVPPAATVLPAAESPGVAAAPEQTESEPQAQPAAQKPTGATTTPEEPCVAEPVTVKSCSAEPVSVRHGETERDQEKPCLTEPDLERPCSVDSGAVLELPALAEAGTEVQSCRLEAPVTTPVHGDGGDVEMEDELTFKVPTKRKKKKLDFTAQGALVRSRFTSVTEMDAPSKFFFSLEQKNGQKRFIHAVPTESGDLLSEPTEIRKQTVHFYSKLYSSKKSGAQIVEESFLKDLPKLSGQVARELDGELTLAELQEALQGMENAQAPGIDGLPVEFYKAFWAVIGQDVLEVLRDSMNVGQLPLSCRRAVKTLLPKKGDLIHLKNWRPVSILCTDIKLLSKALASRLTKVMEQITHQDQSYCVPDSGPDVWI